MIRTKESLAELIQSKEFIPYIDDAEDPRDKKVHWSIFGDCRYDLLWLVATNVSTGEQAIECVPSRVQISTPMKDRGDHILPLDAVLVNEHSDYMWKKYEDRLTK